MAKYLSLLKQRLGRFSAWKLEYIPKDCNEKADALVAVATSLPITETVSYPSIISRILQLSLPG